MKLSTTLCAKIDEWVKRYPPERKASGVLQALHYTQEENGGSLTRDLLDAVADYLGMPHTLVYEVATFYTLFYLQPMGKRVISVCTNISCLLRGSEDILAHLQQRLQIKAGETSADGQFSLREVECLGACVGAPMMQIGKEYYEHLTFEKIDEILSSLRHHNDDLA